jgi:hypothetical protein
MALSLVLVPTLVPTLAPTLVPQLPRDDPDSRSAGPLERLERLGPTGEPLSAR